MSKQIKTKTVGKASVSVEKVIHGIYMKTNIPAGLASVTPPLGTMLGQRGINIANFVKDFNEQTKKIKEGTPMMTRIRTQADRSYLLEIFKPPVSYLLKQAAGIKRCSMEAGHKVCGVITLKHVFEIAKFKLDEINCSHKSLKEMCISVINTANRNGIKIVKGDLNPNELKEFLDKRALANEEELKNIAERKAAKLMRAANISAAAASAEKEKNK